MPTFAVVSFFSRLSEGRTWYAKRDFAQAIAAYSEFIRLNPKDPAGYYERALAFFYKAKDESGKGQDDKATSNFSEATNDFTVAIGLDPKNALAYYHQGCSNYEKKDYARAITDLSESIRFNPKYANAYLARTAAFQEVHRFDEARADRKTAELLRPQNP